MSLSAQLCVYWVQPAMPTQSTAAGAALGAEELQSCTAPCRVLRDAVEAETNPWRSTSTRCGELRAGQLPGQSWAEGIPNEST